MTMGSNAPSTPWEFFKRGVPLESQYKFYIPCASQFVIKAWQANLGLLQPTILFSLDSS